MESVKLKPQEYLDWILKHPELLDNEMDRLESTFPLLVSYYERLRKAKGIKHQQDIINQNKELHQEFLYLCKNNLLFFLTVMGRYDIIRELFTRHHLSSKERYLIYLGKLEQLEGKPKVAPELLTSTSLKPQKPQTEWERMANSLSYLDFYAYYTKEVERISVTHYESQIVLLDRAYVSRVARLNQALLILQNNPNLTDGEKQELNQLVNKFKIKHKKQRVVSSALSKIEALNQEYLDKKAQYEEMEEINRFLEKISAKNSAIKALFEKGLEIDEAIKEELAINEQNFVKQLTELNTHLKVAQQKSDEAVYGHFDNIIRFINNCPKAGMTDYLDEACKKLEANKEHYKSLGSFEEKQAFLKECSKELKQIEQVFQSRFSQDTLNAFMKEEALFNGAIMQTPSLKAAREHLIDSEHVELQEELMMEAPLEAQPEENKHNTEPSMQLEASEIHLGQPLDAPTVLEAEPAQFPKEADPQQKLKVEMQKLREEPLELDEGSQENYEEAINQLTKNLSLIQVNNVLKEDDLILVKQINNLIKAIKSNGFEQIHPASLKSLCDQVDVLEGRYKQLDGNTAALSNLYKFITTDSEPKAQIQP